MYDSKRLRRGFGGGQSVGFFELEAHAHHGVLRRSGPVLDVSRGDDRVVRQESYIKDFKPLKVGSMQFEKGRGTVTLSAVDIPGASVMDFRLLMFFRIE